MYGMQHMVACSHNDCSLHAQFICIESDKFIFSLPQLKGLRCFEIAHHETAASLWVSNPEFGCKCLRKTCNGRVMSKRQNKIMKRLNPPAYSVSTSTQFIYCYIKIWFG